jgi:hypothetical protein
MDKAKRKVIADLYDAIKNGRTVLGFDEEKEVGVISIVDYRQEDTKLLPAAEIAFPLVMPDVVVE